MSKSSLDTTDIKGPGYKQRDKKAKAKTRKQKQSRRVNRKRGKA